MMKRAVRPLRRMTRPTMARSSGAKAGASSPEPSAMTSMEALPGSLDPPSMFRMALAVASRMSRMLTLRRLLRRAYWLANSMKREKRMAL